MIALDASSASTFTEDFPRVTLFPSKESDTLASAWLHPEARRKLCQIIRNGILKEVPEIAETFLAKCAMVAHKQVADRDATAILRSVLQSSNGERSKASYAQDESQRIQRRVQQIVTELPDHFTPTSFLDIGCGDGEITAQLAQRWRLEADKVLGMDVYDRHEPSVYFTYERNRGTNIPMADCSVDFVCLLMVLHHESDPAALLSEVHRVLRPDGFALIREHDASEESDQLLFHALDVLYYGVFNAFEGIPVPATYQSAEYWRTLLERVGFGSVASSSPEPDSPIKPKHLWMQKVKSQRGGV